MRKMIFSSPRIASTSDSLDSAIKMDRDQLLGLIVLQTDRQGYISRILVNAKKNGEDKSLIGLENRLHILDSYWSQYERDHAIIRTSRDEVIRSSDYIKRGNYEDTSEIYMLRKMELRTLMEAFQGSMADGAAEETARPPQATVPELPLPRIPIPTFNGDFDRWRSFRDMFKSLVGNNAALQDDVHKLHYLKQHVTGEPEQLLRNYPVTNDGFRDAWSALCERYDNTRRLVNAYLNSFFDLRPMKQESASELRRLLDRTSEIRSSLRQLNRPVETWDDVFVNRTICRLEAASRRDWEKATNREREPVSWEALVEFLASRLRELEAIDGGPRSSTDRGRGALLPGSTNERGHSVRTHHVAEAKRRPCAHCRGSHPLWDCAAFKRLATKVGRERVIGWGLCYNCLSPQHQGASVPWAVVVGSAVSRIIPLSTARKKPRAHPLQVTPSPPPSRPPP
ncbi:uncharacterized protein LOC116853326 [Odontomachus brunneus]|uniref:uncharacterized protein LOC116853326 n=1 Tax=Odontomachus brunneus TaxID=486640 RepID=UPI0013F1B7EB|nr:uncharacterized protein LOC116853326 [Odontomachus brunneus]